MSALKVSIFIVFIVFSTVFLFTKYSKTPHNPFTDVRRVSEGKSHHIDTVKFYYPIDTIVDGSGYRIDTVRRSFVLAGKDGKAYFTHLKRKE